MGKDERMLASLSLGDPAKYLLYVLFPKPGYILRLFFFLSSRQLELQTHEPHPKLYGIMP